MTVEQLKDKYNSGDFYWRTKQGNWELAQKLEDNGFEISDVLYTGIVKVKLPKWYIEAKKIDKKLVLINKILAVTGAFDSLNIGVHYFTIKQNF